MNAITVTLAAVSLFATASSACGAIVFSGNFITGSSQATMTITAPITLDITTSGTAIYLVFDEWVPAPNGGGTNVRPDPTSQTFDISNNGTQVNPTFTFLNDDTLAFNDLTSRDGILGFSGVVVTAGTSLTIAPASYTFTSASFFNPAVNGLNFTGDVFLINSSFQRLSGITPVPEPSGVLMLLAGFMGSLWRRR